MDTEIKQEGAPKGRAPGMLLSPGDTQTGSHGGTDTGEQGRVPACTEMRDAGFREADMFEAARCLLSGVYVLAVCADCFFFFPKDSQVPV